MKENLIQLENLEDRLVAAVDGEQLLHYTSNIAKWVRVSGTQDEVDSLVYCKGVLEGLGYETKLTFHDAFISVPVEAHVEILAPNRRIFAR